MDAEPSRSYLAYQARDRISQIREGRKDIERLGVLFYSNKLGDEKAADALMERGLVYETKLCDYENAINDNGGKYEVWIQNRWVHRLEDRGNTGGVSPDRF